MTNIHSKRQSGSDVQRAALVSDMRCSLHILALPGHQFLSHRGAPRQITAPAATRQRLPSGRRCQGPEVSTCHWTGIPPCQWRHQCLQHRDWMMGGRLLEEDEESPHQVLPLSHQLPARTHVQNLSSAKLFPTHPPLELNSIPGKTSNSPKVSSVIYICIYIKECWSSERTRCAEKMYTTRFRVYIGSIYTECIVHLNGNSTEIFSSGQFVMLSSS